jgi:hypothetical protein
MTGERIATLCAPHASLAEVGSNDACYYSFLAQAGYLCVPEGEETDVESNAKTVLAFPNREIELAWGEFVMRRYYAGSGSEISGIFSLRRRPAQFAEALAKCMTDKLSMFDTARSAVGKDSWGPEAAYHVFLLGCLSAAQDGGEDSFLLSNREAGDGRYDILMGRDSWRYIFELKTASDGSDAAFAAAQKEAFEQMEEKRYDAGLDKDRLQKVAISCRDREVRVAARLGGS